MSVDLGVTGERALTVETTLLSHSPTRFQLAKVWGHHLSLPLCQQVAVGTSRDRGQESNRPSIMDLLAPH